MADVVKAWRASSALQASTSAIPPSYRASRPCWSALWLARAAKAAQNAENRNESAPGMSLCVIVVESKDGNASIRESILRLPARRKMHPNHLSHPDPVNRAVPSITMLHTFWMLTSMFERMSLQRITSSICPSSFATQFARIYSGALLIPTFTFILCTLSFQ